MKREMKKKSPYTILEVIEFSEYAQEMNRANREKFKSKLNLQYLDEFIIKKLHNWGGEYSVKDEKRDLKSYLPCTFPWYASVILWDGTVVPCPQDFFGNYKIGNVSDNMLSELWNNDKMVSLREKMVNNDIQDLKSCANCDRLYRKTIFGVPTQYLIPFLLDNVGYSRLRKLIRSHER